ncbi:hypothetical protein LTR49_005065 [Elasticomyces elasticus]|nr:hypothetical protein LTR49_005065 [Elasticomyces elasticus]KAK5765879.1 hypothetical protein LTS12_003886 [Elasticomyces elasticus]
MREHGIDVQLRHKDDGRIHEHLDPALVRTPQHSVTYVVEGDEHIFHAFLTFDKTFKLFGAQGVMISVVYDDAIRHSWIDKKDLAKGYEYRIDPMASALATVADGGHVVTDPEYPVFVYIQRGSLMKRPSNNATVHVSFADPVEPREDMGPPEPRHQDEYPFAIPFSYFRPMAGNRGTEPYIFEFHNLGHVPYVDNDERMFPVEGNDIDEGQGYEHNQGTSVEPLRASNTRQSLPRPHAASELSAQTDNITQAFADQSLAVRRSGSIAGPSRVFKGKATEVLDLAPEVYEEDWEASRQHEERQAVRTTTAMVGGLDHAHTESAGSGDQATPRPARRGSTASASTRTFGASSTYRASPISQVAQDPHQLPLQSAMQQRLRRREEEIEMDSRKSQSTPDRQTTPSVGRVNDNRPDADRKRKREDNDGPSQPRRKERRGSQQMPDVLEVANVAPTATNDRANIPVSTLTHGLAAMCGIVGGAAGMVWYLASEHAQWPAG